MIIKNKNYELSPRRAADVLDLAAAVEAKQDHDGVSYVFTMAQVVNDSLKSTGLKLPWYKRFQYRKFISGKGIRFILENVSIPDLLEANEEILALEGSKKKVVPEK